MMTVRLNGQDRECPEGMTMGELLQSLGLSAVRVAVERNGAIVSRERFSDTVLAGGDRLEVVQFVGGG